MDFSCSNGEIPEVVVPGVEVEIERLLINAMSKGI